MVRYKEKVFSFGFMRKSVNFLLNFIIFLSILDAIVVKYLLKWLATSKGFEDIFPFILRFIKLP